MLLQNLTLLAGNTVVQVTNIAPPTAKATSPAQVEAAPLPSVPAFAAPILPSPQETDAQPAFSPQQSSLIIVSSSAPGAMASSTAYTGEPTLNGLEGARRAAQAAADRQWLQHLAREIGESPALARAAYAEAAALGRDDDFRSEPATTLW